MSERKGSSSEKTYRSRNRAIAALVQSSKNIVITDLSVDSASINTLISTASDSDRTAGTDPRVFRMDSIGALNVLSQHNGLGAEIGQVRVGDIAYLAGGAGRGDAYVLTNIAGPGAGYTNTNFRVQTNNGTITRAYFDIVPAGQLPSENFGIGMAVARNSGGADARTITAVSDTGAMYGGAPNLGYIDFTPSMAGYAPPFDNQYMYVNIAPLTTFHQLSFDSAMVSAIVGTALDSALTTQLIDSAYVQLRDRFQDSSGISAIVDSAYIQLRQSGGAITVQEEGSSLSTSATTLNFVGSGVTATGSGATKTITVSGGGGGGGGLDSATTLNLVNSQAKQTTFTYTTAHPTTTISGNDDNGAALVYNSGNIIVFQNGILLVDSADYTATTGNSVVLGVATDSGDIVSITKFTGAGGTDHAQYKFVSASPQTTFSGLATHGGTLSYDVGNVQVFLNGILLVDSQDYTATSGTSIVLAQTTDSNDVVVVSKFGGGSSNALLGGMFRTNPQTLTINTTIDSSLNAHCAGPISFDSGITLTINGNLVIS